MKKEIKTSYKVNNLQNESIPIKRERTSNIFFIYNMPTFRGTKNFIFYNESEKNIF